jgi:inward rectifier potassium channel
MCGATSIENTSRTEKQRSAPRAVPLRRWQRVGVPAGCEYYFPMKQQPFDPGITQSYDGRVRRIVNRDGSFNVRRPVNRLQDLHLYQFFIQLSWPAFFAVVLAAFLGVTLACTGLYFAAGIRGLQGLADGSPAERFFQVFFFSVQTLTTVGYGNIAPRGMGVNVVASIEAMMGVLGFAFSAGLLYGRFSRPSARILFSSFAIVAPYQGVTGLQFRIANRRTNAIVDIEATVMLMTVQGTGKEARRVYAKLELERSTVFFLPLTWTIVHPIDSSSPLFGKSPEELASQAAEIIVLIRGFDDTFSQVVNARCSYRSDEILWGYRFRPAFHNDENGHLLLDLSKMDDVNKV